MEEGSEVFPAGEVMHSCYVCMFIVYCTVQACIYYVYVCMYVVSITNVDFHVINEGKGK